MIHSKINKPSSNVPREEQLFKLLESIDWKLWEMYNMMKDNLPKKPENNEKIKKES